MKVYQLAVRGILKHLNGLEKVYSQRVYRTREKAESKMEDFKKRCLDDNRLMALEEIDKWAVVELLVEDE